MFQIQLCSYKLLVVRGLVVDSLKLLILETTSSVPVLQIMPLTAGTNRNFLTSFFFFYLFSFPIMMQNRTFEF